VNRSFLSIETYDGHGSIYVKYLNAWGDLIYRMQVVLMTSSVVDRGHIAISCFVPFYSFSQ